MAAERFITAAIRTDIVLPDPKGVRVQVWEHACNTLMDTLRGRCTKKRNDIDFFYSPSAHPCGFWPGFALFDGHWRWVQRVLFFGSTDWLDKKRLRNKNAVIVSLCSSLHRPRNWIFVRQTDNLNDLVCVTEVPALEPLKESEFRHVDERKEGGERNTRWNRDEVHAASQSCYVCWRCDFNAIKL